MIPSRQSLEQARKFLVAQGIPCRRCLLVALANEFDSAFKEGQDAARLERFLQGVLDQRNGAAA